MKPETIERFENHVTHARAKHPEWVKNADFVVDVAEQEWGEVRHALKWEGRERAKERLRRAYADSILFQCQGRSVLCAGV